MKFKSGTFKLERIPSRYSAELARVVNWMLTPQLEQRPSIMDLANIPYISYRLREKRVKENQMILKRREDEVVQQEEILKATESALKKREAELRAREKELEAELKKFPEVDLKKYNVLPGQTSNLSRERASGGGYSKKSMKTAESLQLVKHGIDDSGANFMVDCKNVLNDYMKPPSGMTHSGLMNITNAIPKTLSSNSSDGIELKKEEKKVDVAKWKVTTDLSSSISSGDDALKEDEESVVVNPMPDRPPSSLDSKRTSLKKIA
jgi:hypothetical protein